VLLLLSFTKTFSARRDLLPETKGTPDGQEQIMPIMTWFGGKSSASFPHSDHLSRYIHGHGRIIPNDPFSVRFFHRRCKELPAVRSCMQPRLIYLNLNLNSESVDAFLSEPALEKCKTSSWSQSSSTF
jgi:hypothetical protein